MTIPVLALTLQLLAQGTATPAAPTPAAPNPPAPTPTAAVPAATTPPAPTPAPPTGRIAGKVELQTKDGIRPAPAAVVFVVGEAALPAAAAVPAAAGSEAGTPLTITMKDKAFAPRVLVARRGEEIRFPNLDPVFHNVFSLSGKNRFDLGLYKDGASKTKAFPEPGVVRVFCNIHPGMTAYVLVVDTPWHARPGQDGRYSIAGLPPGRHTVRVWEEKGGEAKQEVEVQPGKAATADFTLDARGFKELPHKNKFGQDYGQEVY